MDGNDTATAIREKALALGYDACGIVPVGEMRGYGDKVAERLERFPGSKAFLERLKAHAEPEKAVPWAKSVVICSVWTGGYRIPENVRGRIGKSYLVDSRRDPNAREYGMAEAFSVFLEECGLRAVTERNFGNAPARWAAQCAGIGVLRRNNFYYGPKGSAYRLESWLIDRDLDIRETPQAKPCPPSCRRCVDACPTGSLAEPFAMEPMTCVAFLNTKGTCAPDLPGYDRLGAWVHGCDACQDACPFNRGGEGGGDETFPGLDELCAHLGLEKILAMDYQQMREMLAPKFWYIGPEDVWKWKNNVLNAMRLDFDESYRPHIEAALGDENEKVREMAAWVLASVSS